MTDQTPRTYNSDEKMCLSIPDKTFFCVEYPGIVKNDEKAIETLGGRDEIKKVGLN